MMPFTYKRYLENAILECEDNIRSCMEKIKIGIDPEFWRNRIDFYENKIDEIKKIL